MNTYRTVSLWVIKIGLFIVPFIPLFVSQSLFFPFITGKAFIFRTVVEIVFALWLGLTFFYREYRPRRTALLYALLVFVGVLILATAFGVNPYRSFWSNFERMEGLVTYLHLAAYFFVLASVFRKEQWLTFFNFFVVSGLIQNFYALSQKLGYLASPQSGFRVDGTIGNATYLAAYLIFVLAICIFLLLRGTTRYLRVINGIGLAVFSWLFVHEWLFFRATANPHAGLGDYLHSNPVFGYAFLFFLVLFVLSFFVGHASRFWKYFYGFIALDTLLTIYFTATRGATLALLIGLFGAGIAYLIFVRSRSDRERRYRRIIIAVLVVLVIAATAVKVFRSSDFIRESEILSRFASISLSEGSSRFAIWGMAWQGFKERPLLGWGPENFNIIFSKYYNPALYTQEPWFDRAHQIIFDWLINGGIVGLGAYLGLFATALFMLWKRRVLFLDNGEEKTHEGLHTTVLISLLFFLYFFQNLFVFDQLATYIGFFAILAYIQGSVESVVKPEKESIVKSPRTKGTLPWMGMGLVGITLVFILYVVVGKSLAANLTLIDAMKNTRNDPAKAFDSFERALSYHSMGNSEIREQLAQFTIAAVASDSVDQQFKEKVFTKTVDELNQGIKETPRDPRIFLFLGAVYNRGGLFSEAEKAISQAVALSPKKQQIYFELGDMYMRQREYSRAAEILEKAFRLEPQYSEARNNLAAAYILAGDQARADVLLEEGYGTVNVPLNVFVQVYSVRKDYERLLGIWQAFLASDTHNMQYWKNVAATYLLLKKPAEAIKTLEEAYAVDASFKSEAEDYIQQIRSGQLQ